MDAFDSPGYVPTGGSPDPVAVPHARPGGQPDPLAVPGPVPVEWLHLRRTQDREYVSAGVAVLLALVSEVDPIPPLDEVAAARGAELAEPLDRYGRVLQGGHRDGDLGVTASVLQAVAYGEFDPGLRR